MLLLSKLIKCVFYFGSSWRISDSDKKVFDVILEKYDRDFRSIIESQLKSIECVRPMIGGKFKIIYIYKKLAIQLTGNYAGKRVCLGVADINKNGIKSKVGVIVDDGWLYSLECKLNFKGEYSVIGLSNSQKWGNREAALHRIEHGN